MTRAIHPKGDRARTLANLSPGEFENLIYDLAIARGMVNVVWRTPGADGGRDIEAESVQLDASGAQSFAKWYIECKRYGRSVDWPTIQPKVAYADAARAEYLLICTTSKFTPQAINCSNQWNESRRYPKLRLWAAHDIEAQLAHHPDLRFLYSLRAESFAPGRSIVALSLALSKAVGSVYSTTVMERGSVSRMLEASFALSLLLQTRMEDIEKVGAITLRALDAAHGALVDVDCEGQPDAVDEPGFAAFCGYLCALSPKARLKVSFTGRGVYTVSGPADISSLLHRYRATFAAIALWGDFEFTFNSERVEVRQR